MHASEVRSVYFLHMGGGLDQYLASQITSARVFEVVTDPARAQAIFTDRIGTAFESRMEELFPPPPPPKKEEPEPEENAKEKEKDSGQLSAISFDTVNKLEKVGAISSWGRGKGTLFLVDAKSRQVIWSIVEKPKNNTPDELNRTATRIVSRLKKDLGGK
jgi:hypothetical protein